MNKNYDKIKKSKPFKLFDLLIYIVIIVIIAVSIILSFVFTKHHPLQKIEIYYDTAMIFTYDFATDKYIISDFDGAITTENTETTLTVTMTFYKHNDEYNILLIDKAEFTADMIASDCSKRADCVHSKKISEGNQNIICLPHNLIVKGIGTDNVINEPVIG